jgi:hypothetical protein
VYSTAVNLPPDAEAGADQSIALPTVSVTLDASGSTDSDGTIVSYEWTKVSGPAVFNIVSPNSIATTVNSLITGTYVFQLEVTDNLGATNIDMVTITVSTTGTPVRRKFRTQ